ncbi:MAG: hypothetical protein JRN54_08480 [Nitrososphaerota archaeon]|nr:hypothetical protein [Nitrososphaerota archaeon]
MGGLRDPRGGSAALSARKARTTGEEHEIPSADEGPLAIDWQERREGIAYDAKSDGMFPLITNDEKMTGEKLLASFKYQPYLEKRFEQFNTVYKVAPIYLKKVSRIEGLLCLYFLALLVQALIERELLWAMKREGIVSLPVYPEERECPAPTTVKVLKLF